MPRINRIIFEDASSFATPIDRSTMSRILETQVLGPQNVEEGGALDGFVFNANGTSAHYPNERVYLLFFNADHPIAKIRRVLDEQFRIMRVPVTRALLSHEPSFLVWNNILAPLQLSHLAPENIYRLHKQLLAALWNKIKMAGGQQPGAAAAEPDVTAGNLGQWFTAIKRILNSDRPQDFLNNFADPTAVTAVMEAFQSFFQRSEAPVTGALDYTAISDADISPLFRGEYNLNHEEDNLSLRLIKELLRRLLPLVSDDFIVQTVMLRPDVDPHAKYARVKPALNFPQYEDREALCNSKEYLDFMVQQYLAVVSPLELLIALHDNELFRFDRESEELKFLLKLANRPALMEACANQLQEDVSTTSSFIVLSIINSVSSQRWSSHSDAYTLEYLQQLTVFCLQKINIFLIDDHLDRSVKHRQALLYLMAILKNIKLRKSDASRNEEVACNNCADLLAYVGLIPADVYFMSQQELPQQDGGQCQLGQIIASVLTAENILLALNVNQQVRQEFYFNINQGLLIFIEGGAAARFSDLAKRMLSGLRIVAIADGGRGEKNLEHARFDDSFWSSDEERKIVRVDAVWSQSLRQVLIFNAEKKEFQAAAVYTSSQQALEVRQLDANNAQGFAVFAVKIPGQRVVFAGVPPVGVAGLLALPVGDLTQVLTAQLDVFLKPFFDSLKRLLSENLSKADRRNILSLLSVMRSHLGDLEYPEGWSQVLERVWREGNDAYVDYDGSTATKSSDFRAFYEFATYLVSFCLAKWYDPVGEDIVFISLIDPGLAQIILNGCVPLGVYAVTSLASLTVYVTGQFLYTAYQEVRVRCCNRDEARANAILQQVNQANVDPMMSARLRKAIELLSINDPDQGVTDIYVWFDRVIKQMMHAADKTEAIRYQLAMATSGGAERFITERERWWRQQAGRVVKLGITPVGIGLTAFAFSQTLSIINSDPVQETATGLFTYAATAGAFFFGDNTWLNPGVAPIAMFIKLFLLFNLSWLLNLAPKVAKSAANESVKYFSQCRGWLFSSAEAERVAHTPINDNDEERGLLAADQGSRARPGSSLCCFKGGR